MPAKHTIGVRVDDDIERRLHRIAAELSKRANGITVTRSIVIRRVIDHGVSALEKSLGLKPEP